jgi:hypothetical protein
VHAYVYLRINTYARVADASRRELGAMIPRGCRDRRTAPGEEDDDAAGLPETAPEATTPRAWGRREYARELLHANMHVYVRCSANEKVSTRQVPVCQTCMYVHVCLHEVITKLEGYLEAIADGFPCGRSRLQDTP